MIAYAPNDSVDFERLWNEYSGKVYSYIKKRITDPDITEDLTADVFIKAIDSTQRGYGSQGHLSGWLYRIAHNAIIDYYRMRDRWQGVSLDDLPHAYDDCEDTYRLAMHLLDREMLEQALNRLTDTQAEALRLYYMDGHSLEEIAILTGKSKYAVKSLVHRALVTLCNLLGGGDRPGKPEAAYHDMIALLRERGPLSNRDIVKALKISYSTVNTALYLHKNTFVQVGKQPGLNRMVFTWGLVGIHDKEAA